jgi:hypothetical protein
MVSLQLAVTKSRIVAIIPVGCSISRELKAFFGYVYMFKAEEPLVNCVQLLASFQKVVLIIR